MLHRRLLYSVFIPEPLNEPTVIRAGNTIYLDHLSTAAQTIRYEAGFSCRPVGFPRPFHAAVVVGDRPEMVRRNKPPIAAFGTPFTTSPSVRWFRRSIVAGKSTLHVQLQAWLASHNTLYSALQADLPPNIHLLTFRVRWDGQVRQVVAQCSGDSSSRTQPDRRALPLRCRFSFGSRTSTRPVKMRSFRHPFKSISTRSSSVRHTACAASRVVV
jgi:hypothetical protein